MIRLSRNKSKPESCLGEKSFGNVGGRCDPADGELNRGGMSLPDLMLKCGEYGITTKSRT